METFYYAQLNPSGICYAVTQTAGEIVQDDMIRIESYDTSLIGKIWTDDQWESLPQLDPNP